MGRYGKNMRDCCDSVAQPGTPHIRGCKYFGENDPYYWECATCGKGFISGWDHKNPDWMFPAMWMPLPNPPNPDPQ